MVDPHVRRMFGPFPYRGKRPNRTPFFVTRTNASEHPNALALFLAKSWAYRENFFPNIAGKKQGTTNSNFAERVRSFPNVRTANIEAVRDA
jgi:hypothetical protein